MIALIASAWAINCESFKRLEIEVGATSSTSIGYESSNYSKSSRNDLSILL